MLVPQGLEVPEDSVEEVDSVEAEVVSVVAEVEEIQCKEPKKLVEFYLPVEMQELLSTIKYKNTINNKDFQLLR
jgi:hypothetical protein